MAHRRICKGADGLIMADIEKLSWSVEVPMCAGRTMLLGRREISEGVQSATSTIIDAARRRYDLSSVVVDGMNDAAADVHVSLTSGTNEWRKGEAISVDSFTPASLALDNVVSLIPGQASARATPRSGKREVRLVTRAVAEEYLALDQALSSYLQIAAEDSTLLNSKTGARVTELHESEDAVRQAAIELAFSRRMLKYGILPNDILPDGMSTVGFDNWLDEVGQMIERKKKFSKSEVAMLRGQYIGSHQVLKSLRLGIWPEVASGIMGIDTRDDVLFYLNYLNTMNDLPTNYRISFQPPGTVGLRNEEAKEVLTGIFAPSAFGLRVADNPTSGAHGPDIRS